LFAAKVRLFWWTADRGAAVSAALNNL